MDNREYLIVLYDYYQELLTISQQEIFELYYFDNLSLSEIADNLTKSRNAIHKSLKSITTKLYEYEEKLKLYYKQQQLEKLLVDLDNQELKKHILELL